MVKKNYDLEQTKLKCTICLESRNHPKNDKLVDSKFDDIVLICNICGKEFDSETNLKNHTDVNHKKKIVIMVSRNEIGEKHAQQVNTEELIVEKIHLLRI